MISLRQRDGRWQVSFYYTDPTTGARRRCQRMSPHPQKKLSSAWGMELKAELELPPAPVSELTFEQLAERYLQLHISKLKPSTRQDQIYRLNTLRSRWTSLLVSELTALEIDRYQADRRAAGVSAKTIRNEVSILSGMLRQAQRWGVIKDVPQIEWPKMAAPDFRWLTDDEAARLIEQADTEPLLTTLVPTLLYTGMRLGEALALTWACVDLERKVVTIRASYAAGETTSPKSGKSRTVPLPDAAVAALRAQQLVTGERERVWTREDDRQVTKGQLYDCWRRLCARAELLDVRLHDLRHTYASWLVQRGVQLQRVQALLGHSDYKMTLRYAHLAPSDLTDAVATLNVKR
jgi:integrase